MPDVPKYDVLQTEILKAPIMKKFQLYGFFKNLRFFEPYLLIILLAWGLNLFQIGLLVLIREVITYVFEVPSGIIADKYGKKNELLVCFVFYITSFVFFFFGSGPNWTVLIFASVFFGLGEAFRSGTHKAMIMLWMDKNNYQDHKTFVYGRTRSWSLLGSALSGILAIFMIIFAPASNWLFLITIIPYILDFILITTYPSYMNEHVPHTQSSWKEMTSGFKDIFAALKNRRLVKGLFSSATYDAIFRTLKDYIQPIIQILIAAMILHLGLSSLNISEEDIISIILGLLYTLFYLLSSFSSRNAYLVKNYFKSAKKGMDIIFYIFGALLLLNALFVYIEIPIVVTILYLIIYILQNIRRPLCVDYLGETMKKEQRVTMLSVESQIKSILVLIFAPLFGLLGDYSIPLLFLVVGATMFTINLLLRGEGKKITTPEVSD